MKPYIITTSFVIMISYSIFSQTKIWNNWYFGEKAGLNFNTEPPTALTNGKLSTYEGCASISDYKGQLLFYTNGVTVWDRNHNVMTNGTELKGNISARQSAIILPKPDNSHIYYIFTTAASEDKQHELRYSVVDMSLNQGLGSVISSKKNILIHEDSSEGLTATLHNNGVDYWIISHSHDKSKFYCNLLSKSGISQSTIESVINNNYKIHHTTLKISAYAKWIAMINQNNRIIIGKFNNSTGQVKLYKSFIFSDKSLLSYRLFGIEFSSDETKLYVSLNKLPPKSVEMKIFQINLSDNTFKPQLIHHTVKYLAYDMQIAPNNKIYISIINKNQLSVIHKPNNKGLQCGFELNGINLQSGKCKLGLPNCIFTNVSLSFTHNNVCTGDNTTFTINNPQRIQSQRWNFGDGNTSTEQNPTHAYSKSGTYTVTLTATYTNGTTQTTNKNITISETPAKPVILHDYGE